MKIQLDEGNAHWSVLAADEDPVTDVIHKVKIARDPVDCYLLYVCQKKKNKKERKKSSEVQLQYK